MTIDEVKAFLSENKDDVEVKAFLQELSPETELNTDIVGSFLTTEEGRRLVQPILDQAVTKAVKTRDRAHEITLESEVKKRVASEVLKMNPQEEPWQKEIRELKEANEQEKKARANDNLKRQLVEKAAQMGINPFFIDDYLPESLEVGEVFLNKIKTFNDDVVKKATNEILANNGGYKPKVGNEKDSKKLDLSKLSRDELIKLEMEGKLDEQILS